MDVPFCLCLYKTDRQKHTLTLLIKGVDIRLYRMQAFFFGKLQNIQKAAATDVLILIFLTDNDSDLTAVQQGDVPDQDTQILDIIAISMAAQVIVHAMQKR